MFQLCGRGLSGSLIRGGIGSVLRLWRLRKGLRGLLGSWRVIYICIQRGEGRLERFKRRSLRFKGEFIEENRIYLKSLKRWDLYWIHASTRDLNGKPAAVIGVRWENKFDPLQNINEMAIISDLDKLYKMIYNDIVFYVALAGFEGRNLMDVFNGLMMTIQSSRDFIVDSAKIIVRRWK